MIATEIKENGSLEDKLRWAFRIYDRDMSGRKIYNIMKTNVFFCKKKKLDWL